MGKRAKSCVDVVTHASPVIDLSEQQRLFVNGIMQGMGPNVAARSAGYAQPDMHGRRMLKTEKIQAAIRYLNKKYEQKANMSRKKVMDGFLEAIDLARLSAEPGVMVQGWREIGRLCGYYAPEVKKVDISISAKRAIGKMETMSTDELMKLIEVDTSFIEGEAIEVLEALDGEETDN